MKKLIVCALLGAIGTVSGSAVAGNVLIVTGENGTSESSTTAAVVSNLVALHTAVGNAVTSVSDIPVSFAGYSQIWDVRFSNVFGLTSSQQSQYFNFLQGGGGMFLMGENSNFMTRNDSILALISSLGGGNLAFTTSGSVQHVATAFQGPNAIGNNDIAYAAPGGVMSSGTGFYATDDGAGNGAAVAWGVGTLTNALAGALTVVFDVNFMMNTYDTPDSQNFTGGFKSEVQRRYDESVSVP